VGLDPRGSPVPPPMLWSDLHTARVSLTDAAMSMNLKNESLFNVVISWVIFCHFRLCKHNCILYAWLRNLRKGVVRL